MSWWSSEPVRGDEISPADWSWSDLPVTAAHPRPVEPEPEEAEPEPEVDDAYEIAFAEGREAGRREAAEAVSEAVDAALGAARRLDETRDGLLAELREDMVLLALAAARHVVGRELQGDAEAFAELVREALDGFLPDQTVRIRVHPEDLSTLSAAAVGAGDVIPIAGGREVQWVADPEIVPGGCLLEGPDRVLDGRVDQTLERIYWRLKDD